MDLDTEGILDADEQLGAVIDDPCAVIATGGGQVHSVENVAERLPAGVSRSSGEFQARLFADAVFEVIEDCHGSPFRR